MTTESSSPWGKGYVDEAAATQAETAKPQGFEPGTIGAIAEELAAELEGTAKLIRSVLNTAADHKPGEGERPQSKEVATFIVVGLTMMAHSRKMDELHARLMARAESLGPERA